MQQADILFPEKRSSIYLKLIAEHIHYEQKKLNAQ